MGIISAVFASYIIRLYRKQLLNFPTTLKSIRGPMLAVTVGLLLQIFGYTLITVLEATDTLVKIRDSKMNRSFPYCMMLYEGIYLMMNAIPMGVYTLYKERFRSY